MARPLRDRVDNLVEWNMQVALTAGLLEPPTGSDGSVDKLNRHYVEKFLARQPEWRVHNEQCEARRGWQQPYAFLDSYSLRGRRFVVAVGAVAMAMVHSLAVHSSSYRWASHATTAAAFETAIPR